MTEGMQQEPTIAYDPLGTVHVVWEHSPPSSLDNDIHYARTTDSGSTFTDPERINDDPPTSSYGQQKPDLAAHDAVGLLAAWLDDREAGDGNVYAARSTDVAGVLAGGGIDPAHDPHDPHGLHDPHDPQNGTTAAPGRHRIFPNPVIGEATIVARTAVIYDVHGRRVRRLEATAHAADARLRWDGRDARGTRVAPGTYFVRMTTADGKRTERVVIAR
jgi:hypothetical protein